MSGTPDNNHAALWRSVYAAALVDQLRVDAGVLNTSVCGAADREVVFASADEAARTLADKAVLNALTLLMRQAFFTPNDRCREHDSFICSECLSSAMGGQ